MAEESKVFYVGVGAPNDLRKEILGCSKSVILALRKNEHMNDLRKLKTEYLIELKKVIKEIDFLDNKLKEAFPKTSVVVKKALKKKEEPVDSKKEKQKKQKPAKKTDMEKLEDELATIESKLKKI